MIIHIIQINTDTQWLVNTSSRLLNNTTDSTTLSTKHNHRK